MVIRRLYPKVPAVTTVNHLVSVVQHLYVGFEPSICVAILGHQTALYQAIEYG